MADACLALARRWLTVRWPSLQMFDCCSQLEHRPNPLHPAQAEEQDLSAFGEADVKTLSSHQLVEFLSLLLQEVKTLWASTFGHMTHLSVPPGSSSSDPREEDAGGV